MRGILYFALGREFVREAEVSAVSVRRYMPGIKIAISTDSDIDSSLFDTALPITGTGSIMRRRIASLAQSPFDQTLALDTDTLLLEPVWEIFEPLVRFDLLMAVATRYRVRESDFLHGVPAAYPRWAAGVMAFRKSDETLALFHRWLEKYDELKKNTDQPSLRVAAYHSSARIAPLSVAYNFRLPYPAVVRGKVKLLHGRPNEIEAIRDRVNRRQEFRIFVPRRFRRYLYFSDDALFRKILRNFFRWLRFRFFATTG